jgi:hypothetical protein
VDNVYIVTKLSVHDKPNDWHNTKSSKVHEHNVQSTGVSTRRNHCWAEQNVGMHGLVAEVSSNVLNCHFTFGLSLILMETRAQHQHFIVEKIVDLKRKHCV